jgi:hypothetical protein
VWGSVADRRRTYNEREIAVDSPQEALLFIDEPYYGYWTATIGETDVPVFRAFHHYKAVPVPAGRSVVHLRFSPPWIGWSLFLAYALAGVVALVAWRGRGLPAR